MTYSVLIIDMSSYMQPESETTITGFPTFELAKEFARRRVRDSLEELRRPNQSKEELSKLWSLYGEDAIVVAGEEKYTGASEIEFFIDHPAISKERAWKEMEPVNHPISD